MKILARTEPMPYFPIQKCLRVISEAGFDGVEVCLESPDLAPQTLTEETVTSVREQVAALGLSPYSVSYHKNYIYDDTQFELTKQAIQWTPVFGTDIFVYAGTKKRTGDSAEWELMLSRTRELVTVAETHRVVLAEEFEPGFIVGTTAELCRLFEAIPSAHLASNLDLGHVFLCDPDPIQAIHKVGDKIVHCHIENMRTGVHNHHVPQEGDMDLAEYIAALADVGFTGGLALDLYNEVYESVAGEAIAYLRKLIEEQASRGV